MQHAVYEQQAMLCSLLPTQSMCSGGDIRRGCAVMVIAGGATVVCIMRTCLAGWQQHFCFDAACSTQFVIAMHMLCSLLVCAVVVMVGGAIAVFVVSCRMARTSLA
jgi:predicted DNA repair protein MutK